MPRVDGQADFDFRAPTRRSPAGASRGGAGGWPGSIPRSSPSTCGRGAFSGTPAATLRPDSTDGGIAHHACGVEPRLHICMRTPHVCMRMLHLCAECHHFADFHYTPCGSFLVLRSCGDERRLCRDCSEIASRLQSSSRISELSWHLPESAIFDAQTCLLWQLYAMASKVLDVLLPGARSSLARACCVQAACINEHGVPR